MLFGHDDTFFFVNNVLELLQDFDPDMPYIITGNACWACWAAESAGPAGLAEPAEPAERTHTSAIVCYCHTYGCQVS